MINKHSRVLSQMDGTECCFTNRKTSRKQKNYLDRLIPHSHQSLQDSIADSTGVNAASKLGKHYAEFKFFRTVDMS